jgi:hypothetical protein
VVLGFTFRAEGVGFSLGLRVQGGLYLNSCHSPRSLDELHRAAGLFNPIHHIIHVSTCALDTHYMLDTHCMIDMSECC